MRVITIYYYYDYCLYYFICYFFQILKQLKTDTVIEKFKSLEKNNSKKYSK